LQLCVQCWPQHPSTIAAAAIGLGQLQNISKADFAVRSFARNQNAIAAAAAAYVTFSLHW